MAFLFVSVIGGALGTARPTHYFCRERRPRRSVTMRRHKSLRAAREAALCVAPANPFFRDQSRTARLFLFWRLHLLLVFPAALLVVLDRQQNIAAAKGQQQQKPTPEPAG